MKYCGEGVYPSTDRANLRVVPQRVHQCNVPNAQGVVVSRILAQRKLAVEL